jgi:hypothetical protein
MYELSDKLIASQLVTTGSVADFAIEELFEEVPKPGDIPNDDGCRIILTSRFKNDIESLVPDKKDKVRKLIEELNRLSIRDIRTKLNTRNSKKFKGISPATFKFRVNDAERIIYAYGNTVVNNPLIKSSDIILLAYVEIHDAQERFAVEGRTDIISDKTAYSLVVDKIKRIVNTCYKDEMEIVQPLFFATNDLPILSQSQQEFIKIQPPVIFRGSAGSGKTILSLEFYRLLHKDVKSIAYITLTQNMRKHADDLLERNGVENCNCFTFDEFVGDVPGKEIIGNPKSQIEISSKFKKRFSSLTEANVYTYLRGVIKGGLLGGSRTTLSGLVTRDEFISFARNEKLSIEEADIIYDVASVYQSKLDKLKRIDDNDLAAHLINNPKEYDCIIVDEVQDLTEIQILALVKCCPSQKIFFFGDPNQVINPTVVDFGKIGGIFYRDSQKSVAQYVLKETWRSGPQLIDYINKIAKLRQKMIGKQDWHDDENEKSMRLGLDETYWASYIDEPNIVDKVLDFANLSKDCIVIVNDDESLGKLEKRLPELEGRVFTVIDIKGLEYRDVIIYNVVSDNEQFFLDMLSGEAKRSTLHRMVFNKYYVACTRAQDRVFICEDKDYSEKIKELLFLEQGIQPNNDYDKFCQLISATKNVAEWLSEALRLKENGAYKQAKFAYLRANEKAGAQVMQWYLDYQSIQDGGLSLAESKAQAEEFAMNFFDYREYDKAEELFEKSGDEYGLILAKKCNGKTIDDSEVRKAIKAYSRLNKKAFINIGSSDYIDNGNIAIAALITEISQLEAT